MIQASRPRARVLRALAAVAVLASLWAPGCNWGSKPAPPGPTEYMSELGFSVTVPAGFSPRLFQGVEYFEYFGDGPEDFARIEILRGEPDPEASPENAVARMLENLSKVDVSILRGPAPVTVGGHGGYDARVAIRDPQLTEGLAAVLVEEIAVVDAGGHRWTLLYNASEAAFERHAGAFSDVKASFAVAPAGG